MPLNIAICDDELVQRNYLKKLIKEWSSENHCVSIKCFTSAENFIFEYQDDKNIDIILLDIQMKEINGIDLAKYIRESDEHMQIIFITGFSDYILQGYDVYALHYLLKPITEETLFKLLDKAYKNIQKKPETILINSNGENILLQINEIMYIEANNHICNIYTPTTQLIINKPLKKFSSLLSKNFIQSHRSYIINLKYIKKITKTDIVLDNNSSVPLSRRKYNNANQAFITYHKGEYHEHY